MKNLRNSLPAALALAAFALGSTAPAAVLLTDNFSASTLDDLKYPLVAAIGDVQQTGGELILTATTGEVFPRIGSIRTDFPDNIELVANMRMIDVGRRSTSLAEANAGFRANSGNYDGVGATAEIFTYITNDSTPDLLRLRRSAAWANIASQNLSANLVNGQEVILRQVVNVAADTVTATLTDKNTSTVLATVTGAPSSVGGGLPNGGSLMLQAFNMRQVAFQDLTIKDNGGAGSIIFQDTFDGIFDVTKWYAPNPNKITFATLNTSTGRVVLDGDSPLNTSGDFAFLPTRQQFGNFDMQAVYLLGNPNSGAGVREGEDHFALRFRETSGNAWYELVVWPNPGLADIDGTGVATPAIGLRKPGATAGTFEYLNGPFTLAQTFNPGQQVVLNLKVNGSSLTGYIGLDKTTTVGPSVSATDSSFASGIVNFASFGLVGVDVDEYTVWDFGTGSLPATPAGILDVQGWQNYSN